MSTPLMSLSLPAYLATHSATPSPPPLSTTSKAPSKSKPVNVFSNDGSFLERFQRSRQEEEDKRKVEEALAKKRQFADRFKNRGKRPPPPDSSHPVTSTDLGLNSTKRPRLDEVPQDLGNQKKVRDLSDRSLRESGTGVRLLAK